MPCTFAGAGFSNCKMTIAARTAEASAGVTGNVAMYAKRRQGWMDGR